MAETAGDLDVAYVTADSPFGELVLAATDAGVLGIGLPGDGATEILDRIAAEISPRVMRAPRKLDPVRRQLEEYFQGRRSEFELPLDRRLTRGFQAKALDAVAAIPYGQTATYTEIATAAGSPRAYRAAGTSCARNPLPLLIPCHRVVGSGGGLGGYGAGLEMKRSLLALEGVQQPSNLMPAS